MSKITTGTQVKPTAEVGVDVGRIVVNVGEGFYEIYIDQKMQQPALYNGQTESWPAAAGAHRVSVYSAGRWVIDTDVEVPEPVKEAPAEQPAVESEKTIPVRVEVLRGLFGQMMDAAAYLEALLAPEDK